MLVTIMSKQLFIFFEPKIAPFSRFHGLHTKLGFCLLYAIITTQLTQQLSFLVVEVLVLIQLNGNLKMSAGSRMPGTLLRNCKRDLLLVEVLLALLFQPGVQAH